MKLIRTIRLDPSDTFVFDKAAEPGEWAVSGAFAFWNRDPGVLEGKTSHSISQWVPRDIDAWAVDIGADRRSK